MLPRPRGEWGWQLLASHCDTRDGIITTVRRIIAMKSVGIAPLS